MYKEHKRARMESRSPERAAKKAHGHKGAARASRRSNARADASQRKRAVINPISNVELGGTGKHLALTDRTKEIGATDATPRKSLTDIIVTWQGPSSLFDAPEAPGRTLLRGPPHFPWPRGVASSLHFPW